MKRVKKAVCLVLAALILAAGFGCSGGGSADEPQIDLSELREAMMGVDTTLPEMVVKTSEDGDAKNNFFFLSDMDYGKVEGYFYAFADAGTAEEIAVVVLKNKSDAAAMMESLHDHVDARQGTFEEYDPEQVPLTESAVIIHEGRYVALIVSKKNGLVQNTFREFFTTD